MSRVLVTGATGLLGTSITPILKSQNYDVICHGRTQVAEVTCDLSSSVDTTTMLNKVRPDIILNLVALTNVDTCEEEPDLAYRINVRSVENIVAWQMEQASQDTRLIQISTDQVYDGSGPHSEDDIRITNTYAFSKYAAELAASKSQATILRTNFFGRSLLDGRKSFSDWLIDALRNNEKIKTFTDILFSPLSIDTLCRMILKVLEQPVKGVFNLGSQDGMSKSDFAFLLAETFKLNSENMARSVSTDVALKAYRPKDMRMDSSSFEEVFGVVLPTLSSEIIKLRSDYDQQT